MAVRRTAVEAYLIDKGIVDVLIGIVTEVDPVTGHAKWPVRGVRAELVLHERRSQHIQCLCDRR